MRFNIAVSSSYRSISHLFHTICKTIMILTIYFLLICSILGQSAKISKEAAMLDPKVDPKIDPFVMLDHLVQNPDALTTKKHNLKKKKRKKRKKRKKKEENKKNEIEIPWESPIVGYSEKNLDLIGDLYIYIKRPSDALRYHNASLLSKIARSADMNELIRGYAKVANDLLLGFSFDRALDITSFVIKSLGKMLTAPTIAQFMKIESAIHECRGDFIKALRTFKEARKLDIVKKGTDHEFDNAQRHINLFKRILLSDSPLKKKTTKNIKRKLRKNINYLLKKGLWNDERQLPRKFIPDIPSKPWLSLEQYPQFKPIEKLLQKYHLQLRSEYLRLKSSNRMMVEQECLYDYNGGKWKRFSMTGYWHRHRDNDGCTSRITPVACELIKKINVDYDISIIRGDYSALEAGSRLKSHYGMTNGQLTFNVGLIVPHSYNSNVDIENNHCPVEQSGVCPEIQSSDCATIRVGGIIGTWQEGKVIFFDDSFEHTVQNACPSEHVIFQIVVPHPLLSDAKINKIMKNPHEGPIGTPI